MSTEYGEKDKDGCLWLNVVCIHTCLCFVCVWFCIFGSSTQDAVFGLYTAPSTLLL